MTLIPDPRRVIVTFHSNSNNPRARRWYHIAEVVELDGQLFLHRDYVSDTTEHKHEVVGSFPRTKSDAVKLARYHAKKTGHPYIKGVFTGFYGKPLRREDV